MNGSILFLSIALKAKKSAGEGHPGSSKANLLSIKKKQWPANFQGHDYPCPKAAFF
jgi:hypothetical protein